MAVWAGLQRWCREPSPGFLLSSPPLLSSHRPGPPADPDLGPFLKSARAGKGRPESCGGLGVWAPPVSPLPRGEPLGVVSPKLLTRPPTLGTAWINKPTTMGRLSITLLLLCQHFGEFVACQALEGVQLDICYSPCVSVVGGVLLPHPFSFFPLLKKV